MGNYTLSKKVEQYETRLFDGFSLSGSTVAKIKKVMGMKLKFKNLPNTEFFVYRDKDVSKLWHVVEKYSGCKVDVEGGSRAEVIALAEIALGKETDETFGAKMDKFMKQKGFTKINQIPPSQEGEAE